MFCPQKERVNESWDFPNHDKQEMQWSICPMFNRERARRENSHDCIIAGFGKARPNYLYFLEEFLNRPKGFASIMHLCKNHDVVF